ncbi:peptide deformylase [Thioclava sp. SK-1]|uniref:peptide deformylase n=1 Tax=Thioclava sp. SK-1 TaxID=1889770 RepID=UPI000824995C|nr:peptide deformylase [Thioclava sp. SK-1]OCX60420.1 peptide deformylase [Thioclava sp. SK-1]
MTLRQILIHPDPRLKKTCDPVAEVTSDIRKLADDMLATMYDAPGIGLAAPQIGVMSRVFVMDCVKDENAAADPMVFINPQITWSSEDTSVYEEGCLSIPEQYAEVTRPSEVRLRWLDLDGQTREEQFDGLWATCAQHEFDHLNGKLFIDYLGPMKRKLITSKMQKLKRERARTAATKDPIL